MIVALVNIIWQYPGKFYTFQGSNQLKNEENSEEEEEVYYIYIISIIWHYLGNVQ